MTLEDLQRELKLNNDYSEVLQLLNILTNHFKSKLVMTEKEFTDYYEQVMGDLNE